MFGAAVHRALQLVLERQLHPEAAVEIAAAGLRTVAERTEALADVKRTLAGLGADGLMGHTLRLEYPVAGALSDETLLVGAIDLLAVSDDIVSIVDFKTDSPPRGAIEVSHSAYVEQIRTYASLLERSGAFEGRSVRCGLLFTAEGTLRWI
jgi:ATP-dependent helicase/nuclease subunit A